MEATKKNLYYFKCAVQQTMIGKEKQLKIK
jgi:hypothetical protein